MPTQKHYYDILAKCHVNTFNSQYETFCISMFESMMLGLAICVPNKTTMPELLGKHNYQMFDNVEEQKTKLRQMLDNRGLIEDLSISNQKKAKTFNIDSYCNNLHSIFSEQINKNNFGFMFAPNYHSAMRFVGPTRKKIGKRTIFNMIGPLSSPALVKRQVVGVFEKKLLKIFANALNNLDIKFAWVVNSEHG